MVPGESRNRPVPWAPAEGGAERHPREHSAWIDARDGGQPNSGEGFTGRQPLDLDPPSGGLAGHLQILRNFPLANHDARFPHRAASSSHTSSSPTWTCRAAQIHSNVRLVCPCAALGC
jgi:hypothetical protein